SAISDLNALNGGPGAIAPEPSWMSKMASGLGVDLNNPKQMISSALGGYIGSNLGESLVPGKQPPAPASQVSSYNPASPPPPRGPAVFPTPAQLQNYGKGPQFNFYPV